MGICHGSDQSRYAFQIIIENFANDILGPGELKLGLDVNNRTGLSLYRPGQKDWTVSVAENLVLPEMPDKITDFLKIATAKPMIRRFDFASVQGNIPCSLHRPETT